MEEILRQLIDGVENLYTSEDKSFMLKRLNEIKEEDNLSLEELDSLCWEDSDAMFNRIFN